MAHRREGEGGEVEKSTAAAKPWSRPTGRMTRKEDENEEGEEKLATREGFQTMQTVKKRRATTSGLRPWGICF